MSESPAPIRAARAAMFAAVCTALGAAGHAHMSGTDVPPLGLLGAFAVTGGLAWLAAGRRRGPVGIGAAVLAVQGVLHLVFSGTQATSGSGGPGGSRTGGLSGHAAHQAHHAHQADHGLRHLPEPVSVPVSGHHHVEAALSGANAVSGAGGGAGAGMPGTADMAGMAGATGGPAGPVADLLAMAGNGGLGMIAAHVLAGLLCAAWLAWGEAALFRLVAALGATALLAARPLARALALVRARAVLVPRPPVRRPSYAPPRRLRGAVHAHTLVRRGPPRRRSLHVTAPGRPACA
ncbi:hypothetical protein [Streptomyces sp. NPDC047718]|uniref:hypothetical protein n=1 Tax=Streptomyces sp. NPDC047718 TaxID=3155479 RepID=UPI0033EDABF0